MAEIIKSDGNDSDFPDAEVDKQLLLNSLKKQKEGTILGVEKVINPKRKDYGNGPKAQLSVIFTILGDLPECIVYELDDNGKRIQYEDELTGDKKYKMKKADGHMKEVFYIFYANIKNGEEGLDDDTVLITTPGTSSYSFFREALIDGGALSDDAPRESIATNFKELKECMDGFTFRGKFEIAGTKNKFKSLLCERVSEDEI